jgi:hypothetical protein
VNGDYYGKPTQYWFLNCEPENNVVMEPLEYVEKHTIMSCGKLEKGSTIQTKRSMMHKQYADRFIKTYVLDKAGHVWTA